MQIINSIIRCTHESLSLLNCARARTTLGVVIIQLTMGHAACVALVVAFVADKDNKCFWESRAKSRFDMVADMEVVKPLRLLLLLDSASGIIT